MSMLLLALGLVYVSCRPGDSAPPSLRPPRRLEWEHDEACLVVFAVSRVDA